MAYVPTPHLLVEQDGPVTVLTLNNPDKGNAFLDDMHVAIRDVWEALADDPAVRAVILTGAGRAFCTGGDVSDFLRYEDAEYRRFMMRGAKRLLDALAEFPKPVVAAVNGPAVGLGCTLAVCCDLVLVAESAYLCDPHVSVGLVAGDGGAAVWPLMMSLIKAKEYLLTGARIPAADAVALGLANRVVANDLLAEEAMALARQLAAQPPQAVQDTKRALNLHLQAAVARVAPFALAAEGESFSTPELQANVARFTKS
jgi:enoyl-CoA hydratase/carnithine racemase